MDDNALDREQTVKDAQIARTDLRDGSMSGVNGPMPPAQANIYAHAPVQWSLIPLGVPSMLVRSLTDRGLIETRWAVDRQEWRRSPT